MLSLLAFSLLIGCPHQPDLHPMAGLTLSEHRRETEIDTPRGGAFELPIGVDLLEMEALVLDLVADAPCTVEVILAETDREAWFWRRIELDAGHQRVEVPLRWFRWHQPGRAPSWERVDTLALRFRDEARLELSEISWEGGDPWLDAEDLAALRPTLQPQVGEGVVRLADRTDLRLVDHLQGVSAHMEEMLPFLGPERAPLFVLLPDEGTYRDYAVRLAGAFHAELSPPEYDGFTLMGVALASRDGGGEIRPSWTHEYAHAWLAARTHLPTGTGDWLQEGLASRVQLDLHPQEDYAEIVRRGLAEPDRRTPLGELLDGSRIPTSRYWQAAEVLGFLMEEHGDALPGLIEAMEASGSADLRPHLHLLGMDMESLEEAWVRWAAG